MISLHPTGIALGALIVAMIASSVVQFIFLYGLKRRHPAQWYHAGQPTIWSDQSLLSAWPTIRYIQRRAYRTSGDWAGIGYCGVFRLPLLIGYWGTVVAFAAFLLLLFTAGWPPEWSQNGKAHNQSLIPTPESFALFHAAFAARAS